MKYGGLNSFVFFVENLNLRLMVNPVVLFVSIFVLTTAQYSDSLAQVEVPLKPLRGIEGLHQAIHIQTVSGKPIILFSTWNTCPNTKKVAKWFESQGVTHSLKEFPRVILESRGRDNEVLESKAKGFAGGNFYVISNYYSNSFKSVWAWQQGTYKMKKDLLAQIKNNIR